MIEQVYRQDLDTRKLANTLENAFKADGYNVQELGKDDDIAVQIKKGGLGRSITGMEQAITVRMRKQSGETDVSVGQAKWADKAGVEVIGALVFWPLMIPATYGVYKQASLPGRVLTIVNNFAATSGAKAETKSSTMNGCPNCGVMNSADSQFCSACGTSLKPTVT
jgi:hypothetical protein